jgi:hypothetical protein
MDIEYPAYVLLKDCNEVMVLPSADKWRHHFEAVDFYNGEYDAWDARGQILRLSAKEVQHNFLFLRSTSYEDMKVEPTGRYIDESELKQLVSRAVERK